MGVIKQTNNGTSLVEFLSSSVRRLRDSKHICEYGGLLSEDTRGDAISLLFGYEYDIAVLVPDFRAGREVASLNDIIHVANYKLAGLGYFFCGGNVKFV